MPFFFSRNKFSRLTVHNEDRASIDEVRCYYEDYVKIHNLRDNFHNYTTVTRVERVLDMCHGVDSESGEQIPCEKDHCDKCMWEVTGYEVSSMEGGMRGKLETWLSAILFINIIV